AGSSADCDFATTPNHDRKHARVDRLRDVVNTVDVNLFGVPPLGGPISDDPINILTAGGLSQRFTALCCGEAAISFGVQSRRPHPDPFPKGEGEAAAQTRNSERAPRVSSPPIFLRRHGQCVDFPALRSTN